MSSGGWPITSHRCDHRRQQRIYGWIKSSSDPQQTSASSGGTGKQTNLYEYDRNGQQTKWTRDTQIANEPPRVATRSYYPNGLLALRLANRTGVANSLRGSAFYYNPNQSLASVVDCDGGCGTSYETKFTYDGVERPTLVNETRNNKDTRLAYDLNGNVVTRQTDGNFANGSYTGGKTTTITFNGADRQQTMDVQLAGDNLTRHSTFDYWPSGDLATRTTPNDTTERRYYLGNGDLTSLVRSKAGGATTTTDYTYDADGNRTRDERGTYSYNSRDQLVRWTRGSDQPNPGKIVDYTVDATGAVKAVNDQALGTTTSVYSFGRIATQTATPVGGTASTSTYKYNGFGDLIEVDGQDGQPTQLYAYDPFGRLTCQAAPTGSTNTDCNASGAATKYTYDGFDRRDKTTYPSGEVWNHHYVATSNALSREKSSTNAAERSYDYDTGLDPQTLRQARVSGTTTTSTTRSYAQAGDRSVLGLITDSNGAVANTETYYADPYGVPQSSGATPALSADAANNPLRYGGAGTYFDQLATNYQYPAREYRPAIQRFLTQDRYEAARGDVNLASEPLTSDRYAFGGGDPVNRVERDGHRPLADTPDKQRELDASIQAQGYSPAGGGGYNPAFKAQGRRTLRTIREERRIATAKRRTASALAPAINRDYCHHGELCSAEDDKANAAKIYDALLSDQDLRQLNLRQSYSYEDTDAFGDLLFVTAPLAGSLVRVAAAFGSEAVNALRAARGGAAGSRALVHQTYPSHGGFAGWWSRAENLKPGTVIDRYGPDGGRYFSPRGTPFEKRGLPPSARERSYRQYEVLKDLPVDAGLVEPVFGPGLGIQYRSSMSARDLVRGGYLREIR